MSLLPIRPLFILLLLLISFANNYFIIIIIFFILLIYYNNFYITSFFLFTFYLIYYFGSKLLHLFLLLLLLCFFGYIFYITYASKEPHSTEGETFSPIQPNFDTGIRPPRNVVMVVIDLQGKIVDIREWIYGITWTHTILTFTFVFNQKKSFIL